MLFHAHADRETHREDDEDICQVVKYDPIGEHALEHPQDE